MQEEKKEEKKDFPRTPFHIKEEKGKEEIDTPSKMSLEKAKDIGHKMGFVKPSTGEVKFYMDCLNENRFTAEYFWTYYESREWKIGCRTMKDWRKVLNSWIERENIWSMKRKAKKASKPAPKNIVTFNAYKPVETKGAVSYEEYERMMREGKSLTPNPSPVREGN